MNFDEFRREATAAGIVAIPMTGKRPFSRSWTTADSFTDDEWKRADSIGIRTGRISDGRQIVCVDVDNYRDDDGNFTEYRTEVDALLNKTILDYSAVISGAYYLEESRHGLHIVLCAGTKSADGTEQIFTAEKLFYSGSVCLIETRASGSCVRVAPSDGNHRVEGSLNFSSSIPADVVSDILQKLSNARPAKAPQSPASAFSAPSLNDSPADDLRANPGALVGFLTRHGWAELKDSAEYYSLKRPGAGGGAENHSVHIAKDGGAVISWSSNIGVDPGSAVSPLSFLATEFFDGDEVKAARFWRIEEMSGSTTAPVVRIAEPVEKQKPVEKKTIVLDDSVFFNGTSVDDVINWGALNYDPRRFPEKLFEGRPLLESALLRTKESGFPQLHGTLLACLAIASAVSSRLIVGKCNGRKVFPTVYAHFFSDSGSGKGDVLELVEEARAMMDDLSRPYSSSLRAAESDRLLNVSLNTINRKIEEIENESSEGKETVFKLRTSTNCAFLSELPATAEGLISSVITSGSVFILQDEIQDIYKNENEISLQISTELKKLFTNQGSKYSEKATKGGVNDEDIKAIQGAYVTLYGQGVINETLEKRLCNEIEGGFTGRLSMALGVPAPAVEFKSFHDSFRPAIDERKRELSIDAVNWIRSYIEGRVQNNCNYPFFELLQKLCSSKKDVYVIKPPYKPNLFEVPFTVEARHVIDAAYCWLNDSASVSRLIAPYRHILARKIQNLQTYALLGALMRVKFDYSVIKSESDESTGFSEFQDFESDDGYLLEVTEQDARWAFSVLLHELAALPLIIRPDVASSNGRSKEVLDDRDEERLRKALVDFVRNHPGVTKTELLKARQSPSLFLGTREKRRALLNIMLIEDDPQIVKVTGKRGRQELYTTDCIKENEEC